MQLSNCNAAANTGGAPQHVSRVTRGQAFANCLSTVLAAVRPTVAVSELAPTRSSGQIKQKQRYKLIAHLLHTQLIKSERCLP